MIGYLIGNRTGKVCETWLGSEQELRDKFDMEGFGYSLRIYDDSFPGALVCELTFD